MKNYTFAPTSNPELERVVDSDGDWRFYRVKKTGQYLRAVNAILDEGFPKGRRFYEYLKNISAEEADRKLKAAGERGDAIHQGIAHALTAGRLLRSTLVLAEDNKTERHLTNDEWNVLLSWAEFWNRHDAKLVSKEQSVFSVGYGYAGTYDAICILQRDCGVRTCRCSSFIGKAGLLDWKSSAGIYPSYGAQVAAYANAHGVRCEYTGIVRIGTAHKTTGGYEFQPYNQLETSKHFREFRAAILLSGESSFNEDEIVEIPEVIELNKVEVPIVGTIDSKTEVVTINKKSGMTAQKVRKMLKLKRSIKLKKSKKQ